MRLIFSISKLVLFALVKIFGGIPTIAMTSHTPDLNTSNYDTACCLKIHEVQTVADHEERSNDIEVPTVESRIEANKELILEFIKDALKGRLELKQLLVDCQAFRTKVSSDVPEYLKELVQNYNTSIDEVINIILRERLPRPRT